MALEVKCPSCKQKLTFPEQFAGRDVQCPGCMSDVKLSAEHRVPDLPAKTAAPKPAPTKPVAASTPATTPKPQGIPKPAGTSAIKKPAAPAAAPSGSVKRAAPPRQAVPMDEITIEDDDGVAGFDSPHRPVRRSGGKGVLVAIVAILLIAGLGIGGFFLTQTLLQDDPGDAHAKLEKDKSFKDKDSKDKDAKDKDAKDKDSKDKDDKDKDDKKTEVPVVVPPVKDPVIVAKAGEEFVNTGKVDLGQHIQCFQRAPDGKGVYVLLPDSTIQYVDFATRAVKEATPLHPLKKLYRGEFAVDPSGKLIGRAFQGYGVDVVDLATKEATLVWEDKRSDYSEITFSPDSKKVYARVAGMITCYDIAAKKMLFECRDESGSHLTVQGWGLTPDGSLIMAGGQQNDLFIIDASTGKILLKENVLKEKTGFYTSRRFAFSPDGKRAASPWTKLVHIWHIPSLKQRPAIEPEPGKKMGAGNISFLGDGNRIAMTMYNGKIYINDVMTGQRLATLKADSGYHASAGLALSDDQQVFVAGHGNRLLFWNMKDVAFNPADTTLASIPDPTDVAKLDFPKKEMGKDPVPSVPVKRGLPTSREYRLTLVGKTAPFHDGFEREGKYYLIKDGRELVVWNKGKTTTYNLGAGTPHVAVFDASGEVLYTLVAADKPTVDERGRYVFDEPNLYSYSMREVLNGSASPEKALMPASTAKLMGKVAQLECRGPHLVYLDVADPMKPCLRKVSSGLKESFTLTTYPDTVVFGISDAHEFLFATKEGSAALYDTTKREILARHNLKMEPYDMLVDPRSSEVIASGRQGADSLLLVSQFASRRPSERAITGFPAKMRLFAHRGIYFGTEAGAERTSVFLFHGIQNDSSARPGYVEIESSGGPSRGTVVFGDEFAILDNGDIFAITRGDGPVAMLDTPKKDMPKFPDPRKDPPGGKVPIRPKFPPVFPPPGGGVGGIPEKIVLTGKIDPFLGVWIDAEAKTAVFAQPKSGIKVTTYPDFKPKSVWRLPGTAQRTEFDKTKGLMYALVPNLKAKDPYGKRGASQVMVFDVSEAMRAVGKSTGKESLTEARTIHLPGYCTQLCLAPDGDSLYLLENKDLKSARVLRIGVEKGEVLGAVTVHEFSDGLLLGPEGKTLYAISHSANRSISRPGSVTGKLHVIDAMEMKLRDAIDVPIDPNDIEATGDGIVFIAGHGPGKTEILVVDSNQKDKAVIAVWKGVPGGCCLKLDHASGRLYVRNTKGNPTTAAALPLPADFADSELPRVPWAFGQPTSSRGDFFLAPDGRYIMCESGQVFLIGNPDGFGGIGGFGGFPAP